jgi:predicted MarR family transcription regulator
MVALTVVLLAIPVHRRKAMAIDLMTLGLLGGIETRLVFDQIVRNRRIRLNELLGRVGEQLDEETVVHSLERLRNAGLIQELGAPLRDFNTYYVTADGLEASRKIAALGA